MGRNSSGERYAALSTVQGGLFNLYAAVAHRSTIGKEKALPRHRDSSAGSHAACATVHGGFNWYAAVLHR